MIQAIEKDTVLEFFSGQFHVFYKKFVNLKGRTSGLVKIPSPFRKEAKPSFQIHLSGEFDGRWHDFGTGEDGDIFDFYQKQYGLSGNFTETITRLCLDFNISQDGPKKKSASGTLRQAVDQSKRTLKSYTKDWIMPQTDSLLRNEGGALDYLKSRGITEITAANFYLGYSTIQINGKELPCIVIPHFDISGDKILLVKKRTFPEKHYIREAGMASCLFNEQFIADAKDNATVYVCEGEFDAIILWQCGYLNVVSGTTGAGSFQTDWVNKLERFKKIVIAYDADSAGKDGSLELSKRLGEDRVRIVKIPDTCKDINDVFLESGKAGVKKIISAAYGIPIPNVTSFIDAGEKLLSQLISGTNEIEGYPWPWDNMTSKIGRIIPGRMIELSGAPGLGKSTISIQVATNLAGYENIPSLVCCLEMTPTDLIKFVIQQIATVEEDDINASTVEYYLDKCGDWPLFFQFHNEFVTIIDVIKTLTEAYKRFGIKFCVIDNLHLLARASDDELKEQGRISRMLKLWAVRYDVAVMLIVHPRKSQEGHLETLSDIRGSAAVGADADSVLTMWRQNLQPRTEEDLLSPDSSPLFDPVTCILQIKGRFGSGSGKVWLYNEGQFRRFRKLRKDDQLPVPRNIELNRGKKKQF